MSTLFRILALVLAVGVVLASGVVLLWYLSYGLDKGPPDSQILAALHNPARIAWGSQDEVAIQAEDEYDAMVALGYVHGWRRGWSVMLWRQAGEGRLGEWFGAPAYAIDRLARRLDFAGLARTSYAGLPEEQQALLRAYTDGLNAALHTPGLRLQPEFVLLGLENLEPWQPWHCLLVERLFAWLAVPPPPPDAFERAGEAAGAFFAADRSLRRWLQLHGFENSVAWAARDSAGTHFFQRQVYGATALPFLLEIALQWQDGPSLSTASLPGTPFFPAGKSDDHAWALLLTATATIERVPWDTSRAVLDYQRIVNKNGTEYLAAFWHLPGRILLQEPVTYVDTVAVDSVWTLRWRGLSPGTDAMAWRGLPSSRATPFTLLQGNGLWIERDGTWRVLGTPAVTVPLPRGVFVGSTLWSAYAAELLQSQESGAVALTAWIDDAYSIWAAQTTPPLLNALGPAPSGTAPFKEALTYLRNWDFSYDRASIAASIFDTWIATYHRTTGALPRPTAQDTLVTGKARYLHTLAQAVDSLTQHFGEDLSQWRWERVRPERRLFPIWSVDTLQVVSANVEALVRYAPLDLPGHGHPSALAWGTSPVQNTLPATATWEAWVQTDAWERFTIRRRWFNPNAPLGRYLVSDRSPDPIVLPGPNEATTTLNPHRP